MSTPRAHTSRRTALALALSAPLVLAGCDLDPPAVAPSESPTSAPLPDTEVVASARKAILQTVTLLEAVSARHRPLRAGIQPLLDLHTAHLEVLEDGSEDSSADQGLEGALPADTPAMARTQVSDAERSLAVTLADAARQAASGDLARALASMSAAVAQRDLS